jgi:carbon-monoxide dehydrogenase medium subunit
MSSSRHITVDFTYHRPKELSEALRQLTELEGAMVLAGGTDLLIQIKTGEYSPHAIVQVVDIEELNRLETGVGLHIGAAVRLYRLEENDVVSRSYTALHDAVRGLGSVQVRNMATIGGNLCNASPSADTATPLLVLGAEAEITGINGSGALGRRTFPMESFFTGPGTTILKRGQLLSALTLPEIPTNSGSAFMKLGRVKLDMAKISCSVYLERDAGKIRTIRVAIGGAAPTPVRAVEVERALQGKACTPDRVQEASRGVVESIAPISDVRSTEGYRRRTASVIVYDTVMTAWKRSGGEVRG